MSMDMIERHHGVFSAALTTDLTTPALAWGGMAHGHVIVPTGLSGVTLTFYAAEKLDGTYLPCYTAAGVAITLTVAAGRSYELPAGLFGVCFCKVTFDVAGTVYFTMKG